MKFKEITEKKSYSALLSFPKGSILKSTIKYHNHIIGFAPASQPIQVFLLTVLLTHVCICMCVQVLLCTNYMDSYLHHFSSNITIIAPIVILLSQPLLSYILYFESCTLVIVQPQILQLTSFC